METHYAPALGENRLVCVLFQFGGLFQGYGLNGGKGRVLVWK